MAKFVGYREPIVVAPLKWKDLRTERELHPRQRIVLGKMADSTKQRYGHRIESFEEFLKKRCVTELQKTDRFFIEGYKVWRRVKIMEKEFSRSGRGLSLDVAILRGVFAVAFDREVISKNPVRVEGRPGDNPEAGAQPFDSEALGKLHKFAGQHMLSLLVLRWTGLRGSDAVKLTWGEVSFDRKEIERVTQKRKKKVILPSNAEILFALEAEWELRRPKPTDFVLINPGTGRPMTRPRLYQRMLALGKRAGVGNTHPHRFRDTLAVDMLE